MSSPTVNNNTLSTFYISRWMILLVGIFYVLPVSQLMLANQKTARATGNGDMCFYNFLCKRPLLPYVDDFNHIFSNIAYIFCGIYFIVSLVVGWKI